VRSAEEILATLNSEGCQDSLPFMPEMLQYCGKRFQVYRSAHKACDTLHFSNNRWMSNAVHLEGLRCDGQSHGGCEARCLLYWKDSWLKPVRGPKSKENGSESSRATDSKVQTNSNGCSLDALQRATQVSVQNGETTEQSYRCQATEMFRATTPMARFDPRQYLKDLSSRNVGPVDFIRYTIIAGFNKLMRLHWRLKPYPHVRGRLQGKTPAVELNLQPGELVQVRSKDEIMETLNERNRNRGLLFDPEMVPYCGKTFRVLSRVEKILNEKTGNIVGMPNSCIILEDVTCSGCYSHKRLFCPRAIYPFWHEVWLKRIEPGN
jgi:hypothetical protein